MKETIKNILTGSVILTLISIIVFVVIAVPHFYIVGTPLADISGMIIMIGATLLTAWSIGGLYRCNKRTEKEK